MCNSQSDVPGLAQRVRAEKQAPPRAWVTPAFLDGCLWKTINFFLMSLLVHQVCRKSAAARALGLWQGGINPTWLSKGRQHCLSHFPFLKRLSSVQWRDHFHFHQSFGLQVLYPDPFQVFIDRAGIGTAAFPDFLHSFEFWWPQMRNCLPLSITFGPDFISSQWKDGFKFFLGISRAVCARVGWEVLESVSRVSFGPAELVITPFDARSYSQCPEMIRAFLQFPTDLWRNYIARASSSEQIWC